MPDLGLWPLRALWAGLPLAAGGSIADSLSELSYPVRSVAAAGMWVAWAAVLLATMVPRASSLTAVRIAAPAAGVVTLWAAARAGDALGAFAVAWTSATMVVSLAAAVGDALVDGSSYGPERRFALRTPAPLLAGPIPLAVVVALAGTAAGPLLLAARAWVAGGAVTVVGGAMAVLAWRALNQLSRRWIVFVPAGVVVHDPLVLAEPVLFRRQAVARLGPAPAGTGTGKAEAEPVTEGTDVTDITGRAPGLVLELVLRATTTVVLENRGPPRREARPVKTARLLLTPVRPGAVLAEAAARRLPVG